MRFYFLLLKYFFKFSTKWVLLKTKLDYAFWKQFGLFEHGQMNEVDYSRATFDFFVDAYENQLGRKWRDITLLELGPGDSVAIGVLSSYAGSKESILIDAGDFATKDLDFYLQFRFDHNQSIENDSNFDSFLSSHNIKYFTRGIEDLKIIPDDSIDLVISNAVLEHVSEDHITKYLLEFNRVLRSSGVMIHRIDYRDHLVGMDFHKYLPQSVKRTEFFQKSILYLNGLSQEDYLEYFDHFGFSVQLTDCKSFPHSRASNRSKARVKYSNNSRHEIASSCLICTKIALLN
ncbi:AdoMet_MTases domain containing protein [Candidatus Nanopelagicaceae bacterium]